MSESGKIYAAISAVMKDVPAIPKTGRNMGQGYDFRGIDECYRVLHDILAKHGVFVVPQVIASARKERASSKGGLLLYSILTIKHTFYAEDGSFIEAITVGEGMDSGDKGSNKAMAVAMKYALTEVLAIPTTENKDPEDDDHDLKPKASASAGPSGKPKAAAKPRQPAAEYERTEKGEPICPICKIPAVRREVKSGANAGRQFWCCSNPGSGKYGKCEGVFEWLPKAAAKPAAEPKSEPDEDPIPF